MATIANLRVILDLQDNAFQRGIKNTQDKLDNFGKSLRDIGGKMTLGVTTPVVAGFTKMAMSASELEQSLGATEQLWGSNADEIVSWANQADRSMGLTQNQALTSVNNFNAMFKQLDAGTAVVKDMSQEFVGLSADLSAMWGGTTIEASESLTSALRGNYESLDKYNINLTEAMVSQEAMNVALADGRDEITEADKLQARYNLILEQTTDAQGQFARETNTTAGRIAILRARIGNLATNLGRMLLPYVNRLADGLSKVVDWLESTDDTTRKWALGIAAAAAALGPLLIALGVLAPGLGILLGIIGAMLSPIGLLVAGLVALAVVFKDDIFDAVETVIDVFNDLREAFTMFREMGVSPVQAALMAIADVFPQLGQVIAPLRGLVENLGDAFNALRDGDYAGMFDALGAAARSLGSTILGAIRSINWSGIASALWEGVQGAAAWVGEQVLNIPEILVSVAGWAINALQDVWETLKSWVFARIGGSQGDGTGGATAGSVGGISIAEIALNIASWSINAVVDLATSVYDWVVEQVSGIDWSGVGTTVGSAIRNAIRDGIQNAANLFSVILSWISDQIRGVNWVTVGSTFAELLVGGIKGIVGLVGLAGWLLGQILLAIVETDWSSVGSAFKTFFSSAITALVGFLAGFADTLYTEITTALGEVDWASIGTAIKNFLVGAMKGVGSAMWDAVWGEFGEAEEPEFITVPDPNDPMRSPMQVPNPNHPNNKPGGPGTTPYDNNVPPGGFGQVLEQLREIIATAGNAAGAVANFGNVTQSSAAIAGTAATANLTPIPSLAGAAAGSLNGPLASAFSNIASSAGSNFGAMASSAVSNFSSMRNSGTSNAGTMAASVIASIASMTSSAGSNLGQMANSAASRFNTMRSNAASAGAGIASAISTGTSNAANAAGQQLGRIPGIVSGVGTTAAANAYSAGSNISNSMASGMESALERIRAAGRAMAAAAEDAVNALLRISSPSKVFYGIGAYVGEGFALGIESKTREVATASRRMVDIPNATVPGVPHLGADGARGGQVVQIITLEPGKWREFLANAEAGGTFARNFGSEWAMMGGKP